MTAKVLKVDTRNLVPGPYAADRLTEPAHLEALAVSLAESQHEPLLVRPVPVEGDTVPHLEVVIGERRRQAAKLAELRMINVIVDSSINDATARLLSAEHNSGTTNPLERAEGVLRTVNAHLTELDKWQHLAKPYASPLHAVHRLLTLAIRKEPDGLDQACAKIGVEPKALVAIAEEALKLYYGPGNRTLNTYVGGDAHLVTYPEAIRAALRLGKIRPGHAHAINSVTDTALRDELLSQVLEKPASVATLRALAMAANRTGRLERDPGVADLEELLAKISRAVAKQPALAPRTKTRATTLAAKLHDLLHKHSS